MYLFLVYNDGQYKNLCAWYKFTYLRDIIEFSGKLFRYSDVQCKSRIYHTYKNHFKVLYVNPHLEYKYFKRRAHNI